MSYQFPLIQDIPHKSIEVGSKEESRLDVQAELSRLLSSNLDFHEGESSQLTHAMHAFPAKFPPELPKSFILHLTKKGDTVLDPMMGSGTTLLEASVAGRIPVGNDIDPLALRIARAKVTECDTWIVMDAIQSVVNQSLWDAINNTEQLKVELEERFDSKTKTFVDYWFALDTQVELQALLANIAKVESEDVRVFLEVALSSTIITKSGGVSLALDLAHSRPHRAKRVFAQDGSLIVEDPLIDPQSPRFAILTKKLRSPIDEFRKRALKNLQYIQTVPVRDEVPVFLQGDARMLDLQDDSVDLVFTSPPYASNAIDYMRVNKFSLVWFGAPIEDLSAKRNEYIGGEATAKMELAPLPRNCEILVEKVRQQDLKRSRALHRYYTEMGGALLEMKRVAKHGKAIVLVVGNSMMRGVDTRTAECLGEIGESIGLTLIGIGTRNLDRGRRMMPSTSARNSSSMIEQRMHEEYVIGFIKP